MSIGDMIFTWWNGSVAVCTVIDMFIYGFLRIPIRTVCNNVADLTRMQSGQVDLSEFC